MASQDIQFQNVLTPRDSVKTSENSLRPGKTEPYFRQTTQCLRKYCKYSYTIILMESFTQGASVVGMIIYFLILSECAMQLLNIIE